MWEFSHATKTTPEVTEVILFFTFRTRAGIIQLRDVFFSMQKETNIEVLLTGLKKKRGKSLVGGIKGKKSRRKFLRNKL